ncbi:hypothetical protein ScPMuIL_012159 [Solemya velum]
MRKEVILLLVSAVLVHGLMKNGKNTSCKDLRQKCDWTCPFNFIRCHSVCSAYYNDCRINYRTNLPIRVPWFQREE